MSSAVSNASQATGDKVKNVSDDAQDKVDKASSQASKQGEGILNGVGSLVSDATQLAQEKVGLAQQISQSKASEVTDKAQDQSSQLKSSVESAGDEAKSEAEHVAHDSKQAGTKLYDQATSLASNTIEYVKKAAGLTQAKTGEAKDRALSEIDSHSTSTGGPTVSGLVNQARDLTGDALGTVKSYVAVAQAKTNESAGGVHAKAQEAKGEAVEKLDDTNQASYVDQARHIAASLIEQAQNVISTAGKKVEEHTPDNTNQSITEQAGEATKNLQDKMVDQASNLQSKTHDAVDSTSKNLEDLSLKGKGYIKAGANEVGKAANAISG